MEGFRYEKLSHESRQDQVRVVELLPGSGTDAIKCNLSHVFLSDNPPYDAISYWWGNVADKVKISCDNQSLPIPRSLHSALLRLRSESKPQTLWADAICINQRDHEERSAQVRQVRRIFHGSRRVRIWLGEEADNSSLAMLLVPRLVGAHRKQQADNAVRPFAEMEKRERQLYDIPPASDPAYQAFASLLGRPWFGRTWIVQEVAVALDATLMCGSHEVKWGEFVQAAAYLVELAVWPFHPWLHERLRRIEFARQIAAGTVRRSLLELLVLYKEFETSELRDKIYALCGLSSDAGPGALDVVIDYDRDVEEVFKTTAIAMLKHTQKLDVLSFARRAVEYRCLSLPSWVPDWIRADFAESVRMRSESGSRVLLQHEATPPHLDASVDFAEADNVLGLSGHVFDDIAEVGHVIEPYAEVRWAKAIARLPAYHGIFDNWEQVAQARSKTKYVTGDDILDAYWQTLCAGYTPDGFAVAKNNFRVWDRVIRKRVRYLRKLDPQAFPSLVHILSFLLVVPIVMSIVKLGGVEKLKNFPKMMGASMHRRLFRTTKGYIGLSPRLARKGDCIGLFKGGMVPFVIRPEGSRWQLVGDCYVHGIMKGEAFEELKCETMWFI
jgi:hypothetical protein